jgi:hypothetical protein
LKKTISSITAVCFLISCVLAPAVDGAVKISENSSIVEAKNSHVTLGLPVSIGYITGAKDYGSSTTVINIQDFHCHPGVQRNIASLLSIIDKKYTLKNIFIEGASGALDTSWINSVESPSLRKQLTEALLNSGRLTGSEYYSMTSGKYSLLRGLEDETVYNSNIVRAGEILDKKPMYEKKLAVLSRENYFMQAKYLNAKNKHLNRVVARYKSGEMEAVRFYSLLKKYVEQINAEPEKYRNKSLVNWKDYPSINNYLEAGTIQKHLNSNLISRYQLQALSIKCQSINPEELCKEERRLIAELRAAFSRSITEEEVSFLADFYFYFENYLINRLSAEDYSYFKTHFERFKTLWGKYTRKNKTLEVDSDFQLLDEYYAANIARNEIFIKHILGDATKRPPVIVMISGGFHTMGITQLLEKRKISYITIAPVVSEQDGNASLIYEKLLRLQAHNNNNALTIKPIAALLPKRKTVSPEKIEIDMTGEKIICNIDNDRIVVEDESYSSNSDLAAALLTATKAKATIKARQYIKKPLIIGAFFERTSSKCRFRK